MEVKKVYYKLKGKRHTVINYLFEKGEPVRIIPPRKNKQNDEGKKCQSKRV